MAFVRLKTLEKNLHIPYNRVAAYKTEQKKALKHVLIYYFIV
jgi:hypothetical protein